jgi:hypothetical protein
MESTELVSLTNSCKNNRKLFEILKKAYVSIKRKNFQEIKSFPTISISCVKKKTEWFLKIAVNLCRLDLKIQIYAAFCLSVITNIFFCVNQNK